MTDLERRKFELKELEKCVWCGKVDDLSRLQPVYRCDACVDAEAAGSFRPQSALLPIPYKDLGLEENTC